MKDTIVRDSRTTTLMVMSSLMLENIDWLESSQDKFVFPKKLKGALFTLTEELEKLGKNIFAKTSEKDLEIFEKNQKMILALLRAYQLGEIEVRND
jgi:hypothetical protein